MINDSFKLQFKNNYLKLNIINSYLAFTSLMLVIFSIHRNGFENLSNLNFLSILITRFIIFFIKKSNEKIENNLLYIFILDFSYLSYLSYANKSLVEDRIFIFEDHLMMPIIFFIAHLINLFTIFLIKWIKKTRFFHKIEHNFKKNHIDFYFTFSESSYLKILAILTFVILLTTLFARRLGILGLGIETISLPFKLAGIINTFILTISPVLFLFLIDICMQNKNLRKYSYITLIQIFINYLFVSITINSRGFFIYVLSLQVLYLLFYCKNSLRLLNKILTNLLPVSFFLVIFFTLLRDIQGDKLNFSGYTSKIYIYFGSITRRIFPLFKELIKYIQHTKEIIDINRIREIGDFQRYNTLVIDKYPPDLLHSSGSTTLADSYLIMGFVGVLIFLFILSLIFNLFIGKTYKIFNLPAPALVIIDITLIAFAMDTSLLSFIIFGYKNVIPLIFICLSFFLISKTNFMKLIFQSKS